MADAPTAASSSSAAPSASAASAASSTLATPPTAASSTSRPSSAASSSPLNVINPFVEYASLGIIGRGKYSEVHKARHRQTGEVVAVKKVQIFEMDSVGRKELVECAAGIRTHGRSHGEWGASAVSVASHPLLCCGVCPSRLLLPFCFVAPCCSSALLYLLLGFAPLCSAVPVCPSRCSGLLCCCVGVFPALCRCINEANILQSLPSHPHIIKYKHSYLYENDLYLVLELAESGDISLLLENQRQKGSYFQEAEIWHYFVQIADALHVMHQCRVMHRDIKPANVFLTAAPAAAAFSASAGQPAAPAQSASSITVPGPNGALQAIGLTIKLGDLGLGRYLSSKTYETFSVSARHQPPQRHTAAGTQTQGEGDGSGSAQLV